MTDWIAHEDYRPPVMGRTVVEVVDRQSGRVMKGPAREFCWENVTKYRVIRERTIAKISEMR